MKQTTTYIELVLIRFSIVCYLCYVCLL